MTQDQITVLHDKIRNLENELQAYKNALSLCDAANMCREQLERFIKKADYNQMVDLILHITKITNKITD